jgi:hypothetical protein
MSFSLRIRPSPTSGLFLQWGVISPTIEMEDHPLSFVLCCLCNLFAVTHSYRPSPPSAKLRCAMRWWQGPALHVVKETAGTTHIMPPRCLFWCWSVRGSGRGDIGRLSQNLCGIDIYVAFDISVRTLKIVVVVVVLMNIKMWSNVDECLEFHIAARIRISKCRYQVQNWNIFSEKPIFPFVPVKLLFVLVG